MAVEHGDLRSAAALLEELHVPSWGPGLILQVPEHTKYSNRLRSELIHEENGVRFKLVAEQIEVLLVLRPILRELDYAGRSGRQ